MAQGILLTPLIIKIAGTETYGWYVLLATSVGIIFGVSNLGIGIYAKRWLPSHDGSDERAKLFFPQFNFQILSIIILSIIAMEIFKLGPRFNLWQTRGFWPWLIPLHLLSYVIYSQATDYFRYTHRIGWFNIGTVSQPYLFIGLSLAGYFWSSKLSISSLFFAKTLASTAVAIVLLKRLNQEICFYPCLPSKQDAWEEMKVGFPLLLSYLVDVILSGGDRYVIAAIMSTREVGQYSPAYTLGSLMIIMAKVFGVVIPPILSQRIDCGDETGAAELMTRSCRVFLLIALPFFVGSLMLGGDVLRLFANEEIAVAAWLVIPFVAMGTIFYGMILIYSNLLFVRLKTHALFYINAASAVLNIILNCVLVFYFRDIVFAALATFISYLFSYLWLKHLLAEDELVPRIRVVWLVKVGIMAIIMGLVIYGTKYIFIHIDLTLRTSLSGVFGIMSYLMLLTVWKSVASEEICIFKEAWARAWGK